MYLKIVNFEKKNTFYRKLPFAYLKYTFFHRLVQFL